MIRSLLRSDFDAILEVTNAAAQAYRGVIPDDRWKEPYMSAEELGEEIQAGVRFFGWVEDERLLGVAGIQALKDTTLIRHAYVLPTFQRKGIGTRLLEYLMGLAGTDEVLVGTWADATWAIRFYEKHGFELVSPREKDRLLRAYWDIPERQIETSVVLRAVAADQIQMPKSKCQTKSKCLNAKGPGWSNREIPNLWASPPRLLRLASPASQ